MNGADLRAPRIGMCSNELEANKTDINANYRGCTADKGLGKGLLNHVCSGSGASHGGRGGHGGSVANDHSCFTVFPEPYYFGREARYEGSGGASGDRQKTSGGPGGGIVHIASVSKVSLKDSRVLADGSKGRVINYDQFGSGGGSGGSIQITTHAMAGNGILSVKGGAGSENEGGGGAGGRFVMNFLRSYITSSYPRLS
mmetsp:Transcript_4035/g.6817  ORF Transcript_4035/g.6817 Transcript_4035/m.6817 type:complete len:199 (+) Transcript_4035:2086-2682(+)